MGPLATVKVYGTPMRRPRKLEIIGLALLLIGIGSCVIAVAFGVPGILTGGLLCIAGIIVYLLG